VRLEHLFAHYLERQGPLERGAENSYLVGDELDSGPMAHLQGASISYRVAVGSQRGGKVFTLQTLPATEAVAYAEAGKVAGFSLATELGWCLGGGVGDASRGLQHGMSTERVPNARQGTA
jgi:hypothetical protein